VNIAACWKWVSIVAARTNDATTAATDERWSGVSPADEAALECALLLGEQGGEVAVVCVGPPQADAALRAAIAAGATRAVRIDASDEPDSNVVARALSSVVAGCDIVVCGDYSLDRGTGSVPAFLADELGAAQALGLIELATAPDQDGTLRAVRRLDGGRREILAVPTPAVVSVEGSVARLRRASLGAVLDAKSATIDVVSGPRRNEHVAAVVVPYRPRARTIQTPTGSVLSRVRDILDVGGSAGTHSDAVTLEPADAARRIVDQLAAWGYLEPAGPDSSGLDSIGPDSSGLARNRRA
jgi:electron transfer flavoprotein beta subunit